MFAGSHEDRRFAPPLPQHHPTSKRPGILHSGTTEGKLTRNLNQRFLLQKQRSRLCLAFRSDIEDDSVG